MTEEGGFIASPGMTRVGRHPEHGRRSLASMEGSDFGVEVIGSGVGTVRRGLPMWDCAVRSGGFSFRGASL